MKTQEYCQKHKACPDGIAWAMSISDEMSEVWEALIAQKKIEWLLWICEREFSSSQLRLLACRFVRETPIGNGKYVWDLLTDERSRNAVIISEKYADGKATKIELQSAMKSANAAAMAARDTAWEASAASWDARTARDARAASLVASAAASVASADARVTRPARDARAASTAARDIQVQMIADLGNPFK